MGCNNSYHLSWLFFVYQLSKGILGSDKVGFQRKTGMLTWPDIYSGSRLLDLHVHASFSDSKSLLEASKSYAVRRVCSISYCASDSFHYRLGLEGSGLPHQPWIYPWCNVLQHGWSGCVRCEGGWIAWELRRFVQLRRNSSLSATSAKVRPIWWKSSDGAVCRSCEYIRFGEELRPLTQPPLGVSLSR